MNIFKISVFMSKMAETNRYGHTNTGSGGALVAVHFKGSWERKV